MSLPTRTLGSGSARLEVSAQGLGCMGMSFVYGTRDNEESTATLLRALELGVTFWDTADVYGPHHNEELIGEVLKTHRAEVTLATKFANHLVDGKMTITGDPEYVRQSCDASLKRLGTDTIDLYYYHRVDRRVPIEETWGAMAELVAAGKVRHLGLSEAGAHTIRRAHALHPVTAVQSEWSLWSREPEGNGVLATMRELGIGFVPYSPLGRGFLSGRIRSLDDLAPDDSRRRNPRFTEENFPRNLAIVDAVTDVAQSKGVTPSQLALAWVMAQGEDVVPIPGTKRVTTLEENAAAVDIVLTPADLAALEGASPVGAVAGNRNVDMTQYDQE